jgi:hydrophobic/amphiphilic exporter-1 (mainly G- bacteria), HAE1 family
MSAPATLIGNFQGNAQAFQPSLASEACLVAAAIIVIYIILSSPACSMKATSTR